MVDLEVKKGEIKGLIGPNGSGKTTLLNTITGIYQPDGGTIVYKGVQLQGLTPHQIAKLGVSRTFQNLRLSPGLSVVDNVMVGRTRLLTTGLLKTLLRTSDYCKEENENREKSLELLAFVGLLPKTDTLSINLSYGERRRLEIARALALEPGLLLLDEPTAGMVMHERNEIVGLIKKIREQGITIIIIEHTMHVITSLCDSVAVLNFGEKIAEGTTFEVMNNEDVIEAYLGKEGAAC
ncbi:MAG: ABC transporter ATP-binding protein [Firmicutes bacterium]|jgi:branched-chain amino acid transport system ATP-binding protein|nr:ABC transporter ATP-binding protein [Bacillota bacterium]